MFRWLVTAIILALGLIVPSVQAETLKSNNYQVDESFIGGGGLVTEQSTNFQAGESIGDVAVGDSGSSSFQINSGYTTTNDPALTFGIISGTPTFNDLSAAAASTATSQFVVVNYTSYGYAVQITGTPPTNNGHALPAMSPGPSQAGTEQYGINLVANTSPVNVGANPDNGSFGYGSVSTGYDTPNNYRYANGATIAAAPKSSGQTIYTITYLANASSQTPGGVYQTAHTLICTGTY